MLSLQSFTAPIAQVSYRHSFCEQQGDKDEEGVVSASQKPTSS